MKDQWTRGITKWEQAQALPNMAFFLPKSRTDQISRGSIGDKWTRVPGKVL